jgi:hypothetical protein
MFSFPLLNDRLQKVVDMSSSRSEDVVGVEKFVGAEEEGIICRGEDQFTPGSSYEAVSGRELGFGERGVVVPRRSWMRFSVVDVGPWAKDRGTPTARDLTDVSDELVGTSSTVQYTTISKILSESITMALIEKLLTVLLKPFGS